MAITTYIHPGCGKRVPGGESGGHCSACHESFRGAAAYDRHLLRGPDGRLTHQDPDPRFSSDADVVEDGAA